MFSKMNGIQVELVPKTPKENQRICENCDGIGWLYDKENKFMEKCNKCYNGLVDTCPRCGNDVRGFCNNDECWKFKEVEREEKLFGKAHKITLKQAKEIGINMLFHEGYGYNNGYFDIDDIDDFISNCIDDDIEVPKYVWSTKESNIIMDAYSIVENACEELHEDAFGNILDRDINNMQDYLDEWCNGQSGTVTYWQDPNCAILL